jgi:hypothetical protein
MKVVVYSQSRILYMPNTKSFPGSQHIFFYRWQKMASELDCTSEKRAQLSRNGKFRKP